LLVLTRAFFVNYEIYLAILLNSQAQGVSGKNEQSTQTPWRWAPEARGPMRLHWLKAGPDHHPISEQSSLKYLGVILDKLNWKPQIEKMVTQLSKSCGMLFKLKHYTNISVLKSVYVALFHSYSYSIL